MAAALRDQQETIFDHTTFAKQSCIHCGLVFYWPAELDTRAQNTSRTFWCPGCGGTMAYRTTETERLKAELKTAQDRLEGARNETARQREHRQAAERRVSAMKGVVTRTKKRIAAGKCVRCSCEFPDLANHMAEAHPGYEPADD